MEEFQIHTLKNGIRLVHKQLPHTQIVHCGYMIDVGSRDEKEDIQGLAHFWEHMVFKGTRKRKAYHILNRIDSLGGELNAYTTKEKICFYTSTLNKHFDKAVDLLTDISFKSIFPSKELEKEKGVVLEELSMYYDSPEDAIQDEFESVLFENHALGYNILGTKESLKSFKKKDLDAFIKAQVDYSKIVFSCVGNIDLKTAIYQLEKNLEGIKLPEGGAKREKYLPSSKKESKIIHREIQQAQSVMGGLSYSLHSSSRIPFFLLVNLLGGPGMNSRLNMSLREKYGFVYSVDASFVSFTDTGFWNISFGTEPNQLDRCNGIIQKELTNLKNKKLGTMQIHKAKEQLKGQLAMTEENYASLMRMAAKSILDKGNVDSVEAIFEKINNITVEGVLAVANEMFDEKRIQTVSMLPDS